MRKLLNRLFMLGLLALAVYPPWKHPHAPATFVQTYRGHK